MSKGVRKPFILTAAEAAELEKLLGSATLESVPTATLKPNPRNAKDHPDTQITLLSENIRKFGQIDPIVCDEADMVLAGHARLLAMKRLGMQNVLVRRVKHLNENQKRAYVLASNRLGELGTWNLEILSAELMTLTDPAIDINFDPHIIGFDTPEIDRLLEPVDASNRPNPDDEFTPAVPSSVPACEPGDLWNCGVHKLVCANALEGDSYSVLMGRDRANIVFTDSPYSAPNKGHVSKHEGVREFPMAHGEMSKGEFADFRSSLGHIADHVEDGAVVYVCADWRHWGELLIAARPIFDAPKNLIVWVKSNAGLGTFYRSQHELIAVYVARGASPLNNFRLGARGRFRSNVWKYPGVNSAGKHREAILAMHPTVKPVAMVADALKDCSRRGDIVLDPFAGSGTTMVAAQKTGRVARLIEIAPLYCDVILRRWEKISGASARLSSGETFAEVAARRHAENSGGKIYHEQGV